MPSSTMLGVCGGFCLVRETNPRENEMEMQPQVFTYIAAGSAIANAIFWGAFLLGKIWTRIERLELKVMDHDQSIAYLRGRETR